MRTVTLTSPLSLGLRLFRLLRPRPLTDLKALKARPPIVQMKGYSTVADGGGEIFAWDSGSTTTPRRWARHPANRVDWMAGISRSSPARIHARWFGVKADGTTDDAARLRGSGERGGPEQHGPAPPDWLYQDRHHDQRIHRDHHQGQLLRYRSCGRSLTQSRSSSTSRAITANSRT